MQNNSKLFILSNVLALSFIGCKNDNKKSNINSANNSKQYFDLILNKSESQNKYTNISANENFSTEVIITCGIRNSNNILTDIVTDSNNKIIISSTSGKAKLPYILGKDCDYEFDNFTINSKKYNTFKNKNLKLNLNGNTIAKNTIKSYYSSDKETYISVSGRKEANEETVKLTVSDVIITNINGQTVNENGDVITNENTKEKIVINENSLTLNRLAAPDSLNIKAVKDGYEKDISSKSNALFMFKTNYSITHKNHSDKATFPSQNCFIITLDNEIPNMDWETIDNFYKNNQIFPCKNLNLDEKNNWENYAAKTNYFILANTASGHDNAYRIITIGKMKY